VITPRTTRLVRAADLRSFRRAVAALAIQGPPLDARDRLVVVPTRAAAMHLIRVIENGIENDRAVVLPDFITRAELAARLFERTDAASRKGAPYTGPEREALLTVSCRVAREAGAVPPFHIRPGLVAAMLDFYDVLKRQQKSIDDFERLTIGRLDAGAGTDRGADRLIRQTTFFAAAFREFERRCSEAGGVDEHAMLAGVVDGHAERPWRHVVAAVRDRAGDRYGLYPVEWDALARTPGLERLDVIVTDRTIAGSFHERIRQLLPAIEEVRAEDLSGTGPALGQTTGCRPPAARLFTVRDREEEVIAFARAVRSAARAGAAPTLDRIAIVVQQRLPYVYLAREVFRSAGIPCQMFDALPLAAEPFTAAVDLLFSFVSANFARVPAIALLRSPYFQFAGDDGERIRPAEISALDRGLSEAGYLGDADALDRLTVPRAAERGAAILRAIVREVHPLRTEATIATHLDHALAFLAAHESGPDVDDPLRARQLRARGAIVGLLRSLRDAYARFDSLVVPFDEVAAMVRRSIEDHTFAPRTGDSGVHLVDADSARFGEFDIVQLAGLVDGEWSDRPRRNIFYSTAILRDLGWPAEADRLEGVRAAFCDLLLLPATQLTLSMFSLEHDAIVAPSTLLDEISAMGVERMDVRPADAPRSLEDELLGVDPVRIDVLSGAARAAAEWRLNAPEAAAARGFTAGHTAHAYSVSAVERYQDCPFKFFANDVLRIDELPEDEPSLSPRARGRFIHEVFHRFFEEWDRRGGGMITADRLEAAREVFADIATPLLDRLPGPDAALERARLFGSPIAVGVVDVVLGLEAARPVDVVERWLEYRLEGEFSLEDDRGRRVPLKGVADRIDLLAGNRLRVIDYKTGYAPEKKRALQVPVYALCAQERLREQGRGAWDVDEGAYVAFSGRKTLVQVIRSGKDDAVATLADARNRLFDSVLGIERGEFPPKPHDPRICSWCAYPSVCRKDYVGDE
jgi:RecB family exonuclease